MRLANRKSVLWDKHNRCYFQYLIHDDGRRQKVYLGRAKSRTNDPIAKKAAVNKWIDIQFENGLTPYQRRARKTSKIEIRKGYYKDGRRPLSMIAGVMDHYLHYLRTRIESAEITSGFYLVRKNHLNYFLKFVGKEKAFETDEDESGGAKLLLNHVRLKGFHTHIKKRISRDEITYNYGRNVFASVLRLFWWACENNASDYTPQTKFMKFVSPKSEKHAFQYDPEKVFTEDEIERLLTMESKPHNIHQMKLYVLCALNFAWTQIDLATFKLKHIVFDNKGNPIRVIKVRNKTNTRGEWILFNSTAKCLKAYLDRLELTDDEDLLFVDRKGKAIRSIYKNDRGDIVGRYDSLGAAFKRLGINSLGFKHFRKTSVTVMAKNTNAKYPILLQLHLAHRPQEISLANYAQLDPALLDEEILNIEKTLRLDRFTEIVIDDINKRKLPVRR